MDAFGAHIIGVSGSSLTFALDGNDGLLKLEFSRVQLEFYQDKSMPPITTKPDKQRVLLSFTGFHDPFASSGVSGSDQEGPVLSLVRLRGFDVVYLFSTPATVTNTKITADELRKRHPNLHVETCDFTFRDPTDYIAILAALRQCFVEISTANPRADYFIGTASGTPQMHACWLLLAASGEIPARVLQTHNTKFVTSEAAAVTELDLSRPELPHIRSKSLQRLEVESGAAHDPVKIIQELQIVGDHESMHAAVQKAVSFGPFAIPVLICGESGTGKEKIAQLIHRISGRTGEFVAVNCAGVPEQLAETMLFGHKKGAFTGATADRQGKFEQADGGTLFLDELGELTPGNQAKLLRALQEQVIEPMGSNKTKKVNCRIVAATNMNLRQAIAQKKFREDLFFRIAAAEIELPALRNRGSDITKLALHFLDQFNLRHGFKKARTITPESLSVLMSYSWPGNVRQLANTIENAAIQASGGKVEPKHLALRRTDSQDAFSSLPHPHDGFSLEEFVDQIRTTLYHRAMEMSDGNASKAAKLLGLTPQAVQKHLKARRG